MKRRAVTVIGRVQGVGFRFFTCDRARSHSLTGWVSNTSDGNVDIEVQGAPHELDAFVADVNEGPAHARVHDLHIVELPLTSGETGFEVRF